MPGKIMNVLAMFALLWAMPAFAADHAYPDKPVQVIVGMQAGGGADLSVRSLAQYAKKYLGQPINIVNMPGGSGAKGYAALANAKPDGYTIGLAVSTISTLKPMGIFPMDRKDFEQIIVFSADVGGIWVNAESPWKSLKEFIDYARENPGKVTVAASNPGSVTRFELIAFEQATGLEFRVLSLKGGSPAGLLNLAGNHVMMAVASPTDGQALYQAGKVRPLAFMAAERLPAWPDVPTMKELGYDVEVATVRNIMAPKGTPRPILEKLAEAFMQGGAEEAYIRENEAKGQILYHLPLDKADAYLEKQDEQFLELIKKGGLEKK